MAGQAGHILYNLTGITTAGDQLHAVIVQTQQNWETSKTLLMQSQESWTGSGFDAFWTVYNRLNDNYQNQTNTLQLAKQALEQCAENMAMTDQQRAAAYL